MGAMNPLHEVLSGAPARDYEATVGSGVPFKGRTEPWPQNFQNNTV